MAVQGAPGARADAVIREAAEWLGEDVSLAQSGAQSRSKASPPQWIAGAILVLGLLLAVAAAFAVAALAVGLVARSRPEMLGVPARRTVSPGETPARFQGAPA